MSIPLEVGELKFKTKKAAKNFFKAMLARYKDGEDINEEDSSHLYSLIVRHPEESHKIGCGIEKFFRAKTEKWTSCFWLKRHDDSPTDFSYITCVDSKGKSIYQEFAEACREAISETL